MQKKALIACFPDPSGNPRPNRTIKALYEMGYEVHALCSPLNQKISQLSKVYEIKNFINGHNHSYVIKLWFYLYKLLNISFFNIKVNMFLSGRAYGLQSHLSKIKKHDYDLLLAEDLAMLPILLQVKKPETKLVFDAREFYPSEFENSTFFKLFLSREKWAMCKAYIPMVDVFYTVSSGLSDLYEKHFKIKPSVIRSLPVGVLAGEKNHQFEQYKMVHHGLANPDRQIELMIDVMNLLDERFTLDFYLQGNSDYIATLKEKAKGNNRINFRPSVSFGMINEMLSNYDLGFYFLKPTGINTLYSLPNKFFEFIQARLVLAIGPSPEMKKICSDYQMGIVAEEFSIDAMAKALNDLNEKKFFELQKQTELAAIELSWENESKLLKSLLAKKNIKKCVE